LNEHKVTHNRAVLENKWVMCFTHLLTVTGLTPGGNSTVHIYKQTIHRTTQLTTRTAQLTTRTTQLTT